MLVPLARDHRFHTVTADSARGHKSVTLGRNRRSRCFGIRGHDQSESAVTLLRNHRSRSIGIRGHVGPEYAILNIRESKGRSRLVPFRADLASEISAYLRERTLAARRATAQAVVDALFVGRDGRAVSMKAASEVVRLLLRKLGMKPPKGRTGPRPYDLRHAFAVHRLTDWYRSGVDNKARLPWLSAYMGHVNLLGTDVYLHATPELLRLASDRLAARLRSEGPRP